jgi:hypothetical protein
MRGSFEVDGTLGSNAKIPQCKCHLELGSLADVCGARANVLPYPKSGRLGLSYANKFSITAIRFADTVLNCVVRRTTVPSAIASSLVVVSPAVISIIVIITVPIPITVVRAWTVITAAILRRGGTCRGHQGRYGQQYQCRPLHFSLHAENLNAHIEDSVPLQMNATKTK